MKRVYVAAAIALLVAVAIIGPSFLREDNASPPAAQSYTPLTDWIQPDGVAKTVQMLTAMQELRDQTAALAEDHTLELTIRDELPLEIWVAADGACTTLGEPASIEVSSGDGTRLSEGTTVPSGAELTESGGCEAYMSVTVAIAAEYDVAVKLSGRDNPKQTRVEHRGTHQSVILDR